MEGSLPRQCFRNICERGQIIDNLFYLFFEVFLPSFINATIPIIKHIIGITMLKNEKMIVGWVTGHGGGGGQGLFSIQGSLISQRLSEKKLAIMLRMKKIPNEFKSVKITITTLRWFLQLCHVREDMR